MRIVRLVLVALMAVASFGDVKITHPDTTLAAPPAQSPDRTLHRSWAFAGCRAGDVTTSCWFRENGQVCEWTRKVGETTVRRVEWYREDGAFVHAYETDGRSDQQQLLYFLPYGDAYIRLSGNHSIAFVADGEELSRYESDWDNFHVFEQKVRSVPMDAHLAHGRPWPSIDEFQSRQDAVSIDELRRTGIDVERPVAVEFGFSDRNDEVEKLGCRWLTSEERHGTIGPFREHCAMNVTLTAGELAKWHRRFTRLAKAHGVRYYGWWHPPY